MTRMAQNWIAQQNNRLPDDFSLNFFNQRQQEKRAALSLEDLINDWHKAHRDLIALLETLTLDDLEKRGQHPSVPDTSVRNLFRIITRHEADHIREVMKALHA